MILIEIDKLEGYLKRNGIPYEREDEPGIVLINGRRINERHQISVPSKKDKEWDVICSDGSYGSQSGLLEAMGKKVVRVTSDTVEGYLTADDIIERLEGIS